STFQGCHFIGIFLGIRRGGNNPEFSAAFANPFCKFSLIHWAHLRFSWPDSLSAFASFAVGSLLPQSAEALAFQTSRAFLHSRQTRPIPFPDSLPRLSAASP